MIPFAALVVLMVAISSKVPRARRELIFWGGFIPAWGFTAYEHWSVWYPIYMGARMNSTFAIVFLFIPAYATGFLVIGLLVGWLVSLCFRRERKNRR
jgi:hypothetical protein